MRKFAAAAVAALFLVGISAAPGEARNRQYSLSISPMAGTHVFEGNQELESGALASLGIGYNFDERIGIEGVLSFSDSASEIGDADVNVYGVRLDALYHFRPGGNFIPYLAAGVGGMILDSDADTDQDGSLNYGLGFKYFFTDAVAFRGDVRHLLDWNLRDASDTPEFYNNLIASAGFTLQFGGQQRLPAKAEPLAAIVAPPVRPAEPATPAVVPPPAAASAAVVALDSDRDGVPDEQDKCVNTPWGPVDAQGCPKDSDRDGVPDYIDRCPDTESGLKVNALGCVQDKSFRLDIEFKPGSAEIDPAYHGQLQKAADYIATLPDGQIVVEGYTDSVGSAESNEKLSTQRAEKVRQYLIDHFAIPAARLTARGFGETQPFADNTTQKGRQQNRKVIIRFAK